jgi:hypothetical protein
MLPHSAVEFKRNEVKTLETIRTRGFFDNDFGELASAISITYEKYFTALKGKTIDFNFVSDFDIEIERKLHRVILHAEVIGNYDLTTYSIGICSDKKKSELIRRFHFDYVHTKGGKKQKVPVSHLQYGGKSGTGFTGNAYGTKLIEHWLSEPRLYYPPINLALLLDIVFNEFRSDKTVKVTDDPNWRSLVRDNEEFVFKDYYKMISDHIQSSKHSKDKLVRDICYA